MSRDPPPIEPTIRRLTSASTLTSPSTLTVGQQQLFAGHTLKVSRPPSPHNTVSRQITPQRSNYSSTTLSPESKGGNTRLDEDEDVRPYTNFQVMVQGPSLDAGDYHSSREQGGQSGGPISRIPSRRSTGASDTPIDPPQSNPDEPRKARARNPANAHPHRAEKSSTNLQSTLGGRNASKRDVRGMDSGKLTTRETTRTDAEITVGVDLNQGLDGDEGKYWLKKKRTKGGSRMLLCFNPYLLIA